MPCFSPRLLGVLAVLAQLSSTRPVHGQEAPAGAQTAPPESPAGRGDAASPAAPGPETPAEPSPAAQPVAPPSATPAAAPAVPVQPEEGGAGDSERPEPAGEPKKDKKKKPPFELDGRIIGRAELARRDAALFTVDGIRDTHVDSLDLTLPSVRAGLRYRSPIEGVTAKLSVEFTDRPKLKNAYVEAKGDFLGVRAGQFRVPSSVFEQDGRLSLATADRGFVNEILTDRLEIDGRRPGVALLAYGKNGILPTLTLGVFQGSYLADEASRDTELLSAQAVGAQTVAGRFEITVVPVELGAYATYRVGTNRLVTVGNEPDHFWAGGVDAKVDALFGQYGLRLWLDAALGESWFSESSQSGTPKFLSGRFMAALRFGGLDKGEFYVEPFAMVGALDPDLRVTSDYALELAAGINAGYWKRGRVTVQAGMQRTDRNLPRGYALDFYEDRRSILAQMAVEF